MHGLKISLNQLQLLRASDLKKKKKWLKGWDSEGETKKQRLSALCNGDLYKIFGKFPLLKMDFRASSVKESTQAGSQKP